MSAKSVPKSVRSVETMRDIFDESQRVDKHNACLKSMDTLQRNHSKSVQKIKDFYKEFVRNLKFSLHCADSRSPFAENITAFVVKYLTTFEASTDSVSTEDIEEQRHDLIEAILEDVVIPYTYSLKAECRTNACNFIRVLSEDLEDINDNIYDLVRKALLDRSADKISSVRSAAVLALHRFQDCKDSNDLVIQAIHFHLNYDPDPEVRHNCLKAMAVYKSSLTHFVSATRDIKDFIRKTAFIQIADKMQIKWFTIEQRLTILKNGLKDRSPAVRKVVESVLIPSWVKCCDNNLIELLVALDIQTDIELIEKMLEIYCKHLSREVIDEELNKTTFNLLLDQFRHNFLGDDGLFKVSLNVENVFLWRFLADFCKTNSIESKVLKTTDTTTDDNVCEEEEEGTEVQTEEQLTSDGQKDSVVEIVDVFDLLVPDVPLFCTFLEKFLQNIVTNTELSFTDALDFEFIFNQFMKVSLLLDIGDDAQRKFLTKTMRSILIDNKIGNKFLKYIKPVMKCLAKKGFTDNSSFLDFTAEIISEIIASLVTTSDENESLIEEFNRESEEKRQQLRQTIDECKQELQVLETDGNTTGAEEVLVQQIKGLELQLNALKDIPLSQSSQTSQSKPLPSFSEHPKCLLRCLNVFCGCLEFGDYSEVNAVMQTHIEKVCLPGFLSDDISVRCVATLCLGLVCLASPQYFKKYLHLLLEIFKKDDQSLKLMALKSVFDCLCEHGFNIFDTEEDLMTVMKGFFITQLDSDVDDIRQTAAQGVAKLLIHCRMYSPELLSKLIMIWFTPNENQVLIQFIGDFINMYALAESQGVIIGQNAIEDAFIITLETISEKNINSENIIKYFVKLIANENQSKVAIDLTKKIIDCESTDTKLTKELFLSAVSHLNINEMEDKELKRFKEDVQQIESMFSESKVKNVKKKLIQINKNIENHCQHLSADSAFMKDFEPIDNEEEANNDSQQPIDDDSEAESYNTCPESPLHKRRKTIDSNLSTEGNVEYTPALEVQTEGEIGGQMTDPSIDPLMEID